MAKKNRPNISWSAQQLPPPRKKRKNSHAVLQPNQLPLVKKKILSSDLPNYGSISVCNLQRGLVKEGSLLKTVQGCYFVKLSQGENKELSVFMSENKACGGSVYYPAGTVFVFTKFAEIRAQNFGCMIKINQPVVISQQGVIGVLMTKVEAF